MGRYGSGRKDSHDVGLKWMGLWVVYLVLFIIVLPPVMGCTGPCDSIDANSLLYMWYFIWTFGLALTWLQTTFGVFAIMLFIGMYDMWGQN